MVHLYSLFVLLVCFFMIPILTLFMLSLFSFYNSVTYPFIYHSHFKIPQCHFFLACLYDTKCPPWTYITPLFLNSTISHMCTYIITLSLCHTTTSPIVLHHHFFISNSAASPFSLHCPFPRFPISKSTTSPCIRTEFLGVAGLPVTCALVSRLHRPPRIGTQTLGQALLTLGQRKVTLVRAVPVCVCVAGIQLVATETNSSCYRLFGCYGNKMAHRWSAATETWLYRLLVAMDTNGWSYIDGQLLWKQMVGLYRVLVAREINGCSYWHWLLWKQMASYIGCWLLGNKWLGLCSVFVAMETDGSLLNVGC